MESVQGCGSIRDAAPNNHSHGTGIEDGTFGDGHGDVVRLNDGRGINNASGECNVIAGKSEGACAGLEGYAFITRAGGSVVCIVEACAAAEIQAIGRRDSDAAPVVGLEL